MQTMSADQPHYYANSAQFYGVEQQYSNRNPGSYNQNPRLQNAYYNTQIANPYQTTPQMFGQPTFAQQGPYTSQNVPRAMGQPYIHVIRPGNEMNNGAPAFLPQSYATYSPAAPFYHQAPNFAPQNTFTPAPPMTNAPSGYPNSQLQTQSSQTSQSSVDSQYAPVPSKPQEPVKRERKPLTIVDPTSQKAVELPNVPPPTNTSSTNSNKSTTDSANTSASNSESEKTRAAFRQKVAQLAHSGTANSKVTASSDVPAEESTPKDDPVKDVEESSPSQDIPTEPPTEDKTQVEPTPSDPEPSLDEIQSSKLNEDIPSSEPSDSENPSIPKRIGYTIEELLRKRKSLLSQERPDHLKEIAGVTSPAIPKQQPKKMEIDGDKQYVRDVTAILNKLTPSTMDKLIQQLDKLEMNNAERILGLINVMFVKAVEAAIFCSIYADVCKHFQKKQVTVPDEKGQPQTYIFRQLLLTRCQKEFEGDYRQEVDYEKRQGEVDAITDEKERREAAEQLQEDLVKAKRKKLGNIIFIGELFKLDMLTDTIMYDCVEYLLRDKTDEEALECLCKLLRVIGAKIDVKSNEKIQNKRKMEKSYEELLNITNQRQATARIRFMIQDVLEMRKANWVARRAEIKPKTIEEIHEEVRLVREQADIDRERDKLQRRDGNRSGGGPPLYGESRGSRGSGSRGSGIRQQPNRTDDERNDNRVIVDSVRQYQSNEKRNQGQLPLSLAPQRAWGKGSGVEKKPEEDRSNPARNTGKPPAGFNPAYRTKTGASPGPPGYPTQRQPSRELARENSLRERENATDSLRRIASTGGASNPNTTNSREGSRNVSREQSRNVSPDSSVNERTSTSTRISTADTNANATFDEDKTVARVQSLIEEYTENYADNNVRPVNEAIDDLTSFCTPNVNEQAIVVRELFIKVLEAKPRARKAVGHLLDAAMDKEIISTDGFLAGVKLIIEVVPDLAVDIPLIWQYIAEIFGAFIGAPSSNMKLFKPILQSTPETKTKQLFHDILRFAVEFSSKEQVQKFWQSAGLSLNELIPDDPSLVTEYAWLADIVESAPVASVPKDIPTPHADPELVRLFKSINNQDSTGDDEQILAYIRENMDSKEKYYIRNIVLSYLEACLINRDSQKKIQEDIAKKQTGVLNKIINHQPEHEIQAVYAIQNFVHKLEHPQKMASFLFDIFYEECVSEETFFQWLNQPDQSELEGHSVVGISTKDFFDWLQEPDSDDGEEKKN